MKSLPVIVISALAGLCAIGCILLIIVILRTTGNNGGLLAPLIRIFNRPAATANTDGAIRVPERFRQLDETPVADTTPPVATQPQQPALPAPTYHKKYTCGEMISASALAAVISGNDLFCKKSPWSKQWANQRGKGLRVKQDGLSFADSVVTDTFTNIMWQRYATPQPQTFGNLDSVITHMNSTGWQGYSNWRAPTIEELLTILSPTRNRYNHHLPGNWNCKADDIWSCNPACDSLSTQWMWVVRMSLGRCNYGRPDIARAVLAVREM